MKIFFFCVVLFGVGLVQVVDDIDDVCVIVGCCLEFGVCCVKVDLCGVDLCNFDFGCIDLVGVDFFGVDLCYVRFDLVNLEKVNLCGVDFICVSLQ